MMLLDTCTLLWLADEQKQLSERARQLIEDNAGSLFVSAITAFEIAVKHRRGALVLPLPPHEWIAAALEQHGIADIPIDWRIAEQSVSLPLLHKDPADRLIVATARATGLTVLTPDPLIAAYDVRVAW
jgi:PIN domain nuclease of toxin-antitoxin system